ncbi:MAG: hypothetical protein IH941_11250 [Acidobacteria bacterium]|nr:hypothetical protein [Acidobacteriota bacterium]
MATPTLSKRVPEYDQAQYVIEGLILGAAMARRVLTYKEVGAAILRSTGYKIDGRMYGSFLGELVQRTFPRYRVMLSALVVNTETLEPGQGFAPLAIDLGLAHKDDPETKIVNRTRAAVWKKFAG